MTDVNFYQARARFLLAAMACYALFGSPTPDHPGAPELVIAILLVLAVGPPDALDGLVPDLSAPLWQTAGSILLVYGLTAGLVMAALHGHDVMAVIRDVLPFLFMLLPLFLLKLYSAYPQVLRYVVAGVLVIGLIFSLRSLPDIGYQLAVLFLPNIFSGPQQELTYLANAPTILFAALFLLGYAGQKLVDDYTPQALLRFLLCAALALVILLPVALTTQRASLAYVVLYAALIALIAFYRAPYRALGLALVGFVILLPASGFLSELLGSLTQKTGLVGFNMRFEELTAVWQKISVSGWTMMFGTGWGGTFESPAVGGMRISFTHSLLSSMLLKLGLAGFILIILYLFGLARLLPGLLRRSPYLALALAGPVLIDVFLYASFKSLDFGLILLLLTAAVYTPGDLQRRAGCSIEEVQP